MHMCIPLNFEITGYSHTVGTNKPALQKEYKGNMDTLKPCCPCFAHHQAASMKPLPDLGKGACW